MLDTDRIPIGGYARRAARRRVRWRAIGESVCLVGAIATIPSTRLGGQSPAPAACSASIPLSPSGVPVAWNAVGASVAVLDSAALAPSAGRTLSEALAARAPGISVMRSSGVAGTGSRVRLRGPSGILLMQQPLLYIDGVRADGEQQSIVLDAGGQAPSRLDDVAIDAVECIYVLRGPAATARFGTDAAGGIIHVLTRGARTDSARVHVFLEGGATQDVGDYPANFGNATSCTRARAALGQCTGSPVRYWSPLEAASPFRTASRVHGGGRVGILTGRRVTLGMTGAGTVDDGALRNNRRRHYEGGLSGGLRPDSTLDVRADLWVMNGRTTLPQVGNLIFSILNSALLGSSVDDAVRRGYRNLPLSVLEEFGTEQRARRTGGGVRVRWTPLGWLAVHAIAGREDSHARDEQFDPSVRLGPPTVVEPPAFLVTGERRQQQTTASTSATATYGTGAARLSTTLAADYVREIGRRSSRAFDPSGRFPDFSSSWRGSRGVTTGLAATQSVAWSDQLFLEAGVRRDHLDRDIAKVKHPTYPFASAVWDAARESPVGGMISTLRLRGAYGESGDTRPYDAAFDLALTVPASGASPAPVPVERSREMEGGVDLGLLRERLMASVTVFSKRTSDALVPTPVPPGTGGGSFGVLSTAAAWRNRGVELAMRSRLIDALLVRADVVVTFTRLTNEVTTLGNTAPIVATSYRLVPGYPLFGAWGTRFTVSDGNRDGVIVPSEVVGDTGARYLGSPVPTRELGVSPSITLGRSVTVAALVDYRGGFRVFNSSGRLRCNSVCAALWVPNASLAEQARAVDATDAVSGWSEDASFVKLREVAVSWTLPRSITRHLAARSSSLVIVGHNLFTRTDYTGLDPEVSYTGQTRINQEELFTLPLPRTVSFRLDLGW